VNYLVWADGTGRWRCLLAGEESGVITEAWDDGRDCHGRICWPGVPSRSGSSRACMTYTNAEFAVHMQRQTDGDAQAHETQPSLLLTVW